LITTQDAEEIPTKDAFTILQNVFYSVYFIEGLTACLGIDVRKEKTHTLKTTSVCV
jgi:hypothetical protein